MSDHAYDRELLRLLPRVLRAREFHLYLDGGKRLVDLWREGGKAVLGHKPPKVLGELKNAAERGLFSSLPHPMERRLFKALEVFFPGRTFRLYANKSSLRLALEAAGFPCPFCDPAFPSQETTLEGVKGRVSLWRPFVKMVPGTILVPVLPWALSPAVLVLEKSMELSFSPGELISPVLLAPATRALHDLAAAVKNFNEYNQRYSKIEKSLTNSRWRRRGIYLTIEPGIDKQEYAGLFKHFLEGGFLIPPSSAEPVILPLSMSPGEEAKLAELLKI